MALYTAFILGLAGSLHCIGMCGPIALALPYQAKSHWATAGNVLLYNGGRILTYVILGFLLGVIGQTFAVAGVQTYLSIAMGAIILLAALFSVNLEYQLLKIPLLNRLNQWIKIRLGVLLQRQQGSSLFTIGLLNGLLPCGLVYMAVVGALTAPSVVEGGAYMGLFGLGTLPMLFSTAMFGQFINLKWRVAARKLVPFVLVGMAILLLMRGFQFDVPHDFRFLKMSEEVPMCH